MHQDPLLVSIKEGTILASACKKLPQRRIWNIKIIVHMLAFSSINMMIIYSQISGMFKHSASDGVFILGPRLNYHMSNDLEKTNVVM